MSNQTDLAPRNRRAVAVESLEGRVLFASFTLINAVTDQPVAGYNPIPQNATIDLSKLGNNLTIRANPDGAPKSVKFGFDNNPNVRTENQAPYAINGDYSGDMVRFNLTAGDHRVTATPYSGFNASGSAGTPFSTSFKVINGGTVTPPPTNNTGAFIEQNGLVTWQIESAPVSGSWKAETALAGYSGSSYYTWRGGDVFNSPGQGTLKYQVKINSAGKYNFRIHNRHDNPDITINNDVFVRLDGGAWIKAFSSERGKWTWHTNFEYSHDNKQPASYNLSAGTHTIEISGRSANYSIDRVSLYKDGVNGTNASLPQSPRG